MFQRVWYSLVVVSLLCAVTASAQVTTAGEDAGDPASADKAVKKDRHAAARVLRKQVDRVEWEEAPFSEVIDWLRDQGEINVVPVWRAMLTVDQDSPVTLLLADTTVAEVLNETLAQLDEEGNVIYRAKGGTIRISTKQDFNRKLEVRVYDVTDLLQRTPSYSESAPEIDMQAISQVGQGGGGGGGRSVFTNTGQNNQQMGREQEQEADARLEVLMTVIRDTIEPDNWFKTLGGRARITSFNNSLIVYASVEAHEAIAGFFADEE